MSPLLVTLLTSIELAHGIPSGLLVSVCQVESGGDVHALKLNDGHGHSVGLCQVKAKTASWMFKRSVTMSELHDPRVNAEAAATYLKHQLKRYNGNVVKAVKAYNRGHAKNSIANKYSVKVFLEWKGK